MSEAALRRKLRKKLGSRVQRRAGTKSQPSKHPKPRQRLAELLGKIRIPLTGVHGHAWQVCRNAAHSYGGMTDSAKTPMPPGAPTGTVGERSRFRASWVAATTVELAYGQDFGHDLACCWPPVGIWTNGTVA